MLAVAFPGAAGAQFYSYPSFQAPRVALREYNFAAANGGDAGTTLVFQWRERTNEGSQLQLDAGLADPRPRSANGRLIIGGSYGRRLNSATDDFPLDLMFTTGVGGAFGDGNSFLRVPVGLSVGHRFVLDGAVAVTPYAHPRLAIDYCSRCGGGGRRDTNLGVDVDLGVSVEFSPSIALRASTLLAGSDFYGRDDGFGISLAWSPRGLR